MKTHIVAICVAMLVGSAWSNILACGDKFLLPIRGGRFERAPSHRLPAAILVYANPSSELSRTLTTLAVAPALKKAGYRPTLVAGADQFTAALRRGG